jgi:hypothetical protein
MARCSMAVGLDLPAPAGGTTVALTASAGSTPTMVTVPAGQVSAPLSFTAPAAPGMASVTATLGATTLDVDRSRSPPRRPAAW